MILTTEVASQTRPNVMYTVTVDTEAETCICECRGYKERQHCRHQSIALQQLIAKTKQPACQGIRCGFCHKPITEKRFANTKRGPAHGKCIFKGNRQ